MSGTPGRPGYIFACANLPPRRFFYDNSHPGLLLNQLRYPCGTPGGRNQHVKHLARTLGQPKGILQEFRYTRQ